jgi:hypothetical protein
MPSIDDLFNEIDPASVEPLKPDPRIPEELFLEPLGYDTKVDTNFHGFTHPSLGKRVFTHKRGPEQFATRTHEAQHGTQNLSGHATGHKWTDQWKHNSDMSHLEFLGKLSNRQESITKTYPKLGPYFSKEYLQGGDRLALQEVMATMMEHERVMEQQNPRYDITKDPVFSGVFDPKTAESFRAMTGLRNLRTDPKDPPQAEVTNQNWYRR